MLCGSAIVYYYRRHNTIKLFCKRMFLYGKGRGLFIKKHPKAIKLVNIFPMLLILCISILPVLYFVQYELFSILLIGLFIYLVTICISTISILYSSRNIRNLVCIPLYFLEHVSFGIGLLSSFIRTRSHIWSYKYIAWSKFILKIIFITNTNLIRITSYPACCSSKSVLLY